MKKVLKFLTGLLLVLSLTACLEREIVPLPVADDYDAITGATPSNKLRVGLTAGVYGDMFTQIVQPLLEEAGYVTEIFFYDDYAESNVALSKGQIDLNMCQHYEALNDYKFSNNAALSAIAEVPTAPMGIYSSVYGSLKEIENGATVSLPGESTDMSRALIVLENAGLLTLNPGINKSEASVDNIKSNPYGLEFFTDLDYDPRLTHASCDLSVLDSSHAAEVHRELSGPIYWEVMDKNYLVVIAARSDSLHAQFISDIISIVVSDEYKDAIAKEDSAFVDFQRPRSFYK